MTFGHTNGADTNGGRRIPAHVFLIVIFWICQFGFLTAQRTLIGTNDTLEMLLPRAIMSLVGISVAFGINHIHRRQAGQPWLVRIWTVVGCAVGGALLHSFANYAVFQLWMPVAN